MIVHASIPRFLQCDSAAHARDTTSGECASTVAPGIDLHGCNTPKTKQRCRNLTEDFPTVIQIRHLEQVSSSAIVVNLDRNGVRGS